MANTILTPTAVTREAMRIFHNHAVFIKTINNQYDSSFANSGAKIGSTLKVRKPNQFTIRSGATLSAQDVTESSETITLATQRGVDVNFSTSELTLELDDFSERILKPAMSRLAAEVDILAWSMYKDVYNLVGVAGTSPATAKVALQAGQKLDEFSAPADEQRYMTINPAAQVGMVDALKGLLNPNNKISEQYKKGKLADDVLGFNWQMSQNVPLHTTGAFDGTILVNDTVASGDATIDLDGFTDSAPTVKQGDVFTIAGVNAVNPETKVNTGSLQQFTVTADKTGSGNAISAVAISPSIITSGVTQTVTAVPADDAAVTFIGSASTAYPMNMAYHRDAFTIVFADGELPRGVDFAHRMVKDNVSMRIVRNFDITNDKFPCRIDVYFGYKIMRPELACRLVG